MVGTLRKLFPETQLPGTFTGAACLSPVKPGLSTAPQHSTSKARAPHSSPSTVPAKPGLPTAPSTVPAKPWLPTTPSTVPVKPGLPTAPKHSEACLPQPVTCLTAWIYIHWTYTYFHLETFIMTDRSV